MSNIHLSLGIISLFALGCGNGDGDDEDKDGPATTVGDDDDDDDDVDDEPLVVGDLIIDPGSLTFLEGIEQLPLNLVNIGSDVIVIDDVAITNDAFSLVAPTLPWEIGANSELSIDVLFEPSQELHEGNLLLVAEQGAVTVPLTGFGPEGVAPDATLSPSVFDLQVAEGCTEAVDVVLGNEGEIPLEVTGFVNTPNLSVVEAPSVPFEVQPGGAVSLSFAFTADDSGVQQTGSLELVTNDPEPATITVNAEVDGLTTFEETLTVGAPAVDVMVMIDQSCSMEEDNTDDVELAFPAFVDALDATTDWQLGLFNDVDGCMFAGVATTNTPYVRDILVNNAFPGIAFGGSYGLTESLLELASFGTDRTGPGGCNEGLLRPGAHLHVIVLSDERMQSGQSAGYWVAELQDHVTAPGELVVSGVVDINQNCGDGSGAAGYVDAIQATGGVLFNICQPAWGNDFGDAADLFPPTAVLGLDGEVLESSLVVTVEGVATTNYLYDASAATLSVLDEVAVGAEVVVTYEAPGTCGG